MGPTEKTNPLNSAHFWQFEQPAQKKKDSFEAFPIDCPHLENSGHFLQLLI